MNMDQPKQSTRPSAIPRLASRLPLPTAVASRSIRISPSREKLQTDPGLDAGRLRRPSEEPMFKKPLPRYTPTTISNSLQQKNDTGKNVISGNERIESEGALDESYKAESELPTYDSDSRGRARPSLSERTIETLSQIPPSPSPLRRQSSFFSTTSPMRSPSRPPSSMTNYSRSPSRSSSSRQLSGGELFARPQSAIRLPSRSRPSLSVNGTAAQKIPPEAAETPSNLKRPSIRLGVNPAVTPVTLKSHATPNNTFGKSDIETRQQTLHVKKTRKTPTKIPPPPHSKPLPTSKSLSANSTAPELTPDQQSELEIRKASKSSNALRESIAKAKAARKAAVQNKPKPPSNGTWENFDIEDPFNQQSEDPNKGILRKRIEAGRTSGHLNIAALSLIELPKEVLSMYDFDPESSVGWYESVDLVKFIAADNEFTELPDAAFPDIDLNKLDPNVDENGNQFGGLEHLDLHGNLLHTLPVGFRRLQRLHTLNLANNNLTMQEILVVMEMESLRDLSLAKNQIQGSFTPDIKNLRNLEVLDLHDNSITGLPEDLRMLKFLRVLSVGNNQLVSLPFEALSELPLKDLSAARNKLNGVLIPASVQKLETLQNLDVASNALAKFSENGNIELPNLQTLTISMNRIQSLPDISQWQALLTLYAEDNQISEFPQGFVDLRKIKSVDFTGNDISKVDEKIGLMESLVTLRISNNPLRERKFLSMNTEDLKRQLRIRCETEVQDTDDEEGSVATQFTLAPETPSQAPTWHVKPGGILDRSYTNMQELEVDKLSPINFHEVKCLYLQHNELRCFPAPVLSVLANNLTDLDLSYNPLDTDSLLSSSLTLPNLQTLNLGATRLTTLDPILNNLVAPSLSSLDVSYNRLFGSLPPVRLSYPNLMTLLAADNCIDRLDFDAVQGIQVLDVGNNNIASIPLKIGLLRAEGSSKNWGGGSALRRFEIAGNSFRVPRWQIVAKGTDAILEWLKDRIPAEDLCQWESDIGPS